MEMPVGTNSHFAPLGNLVYGGVLKIKCEIFPQQTRLIVLGISGRKISVHIDFLVNFNTKCRVNML
jgi:hypothetical protein